MRRTSNRDRQSKKKTAKQRIYSVRNQKSPSYQVSENHLRFDKPGATPPVVTTQYTGGYAARHNNNHRAATSTSESYRDQRYYDAIFAMPEASPENIHNIAIAVFGVTYHVTSSDMS